MKEKDAGIVGCWYSKKHQPIEFAGIVLDESGKEATLNNPEKKLYKASLVPTGAMLINMNKARTLGKPYFELKFKDAGEDTFFCQKMMAGGYGVYVNGGLIAIHKNLLTNEKFYFGVINEEEYTHN
jgi:GT2 family glycosyltransferase